MSDQRQREIYEFFTETYNERFQANFDRSVIDIEELKFKLTQPDSKKILDIILNIQRVTTKSQIEAITGSLAETLNRFIGDN